MRLEVALLADAVTVREGLIHVLGGGITRMQRGEYPAKVSAEIAVRLMLHPTEADGEHVLRVLLQDADGQHGSKMEARFTVTADGLEPGEEVGVSLSIPCRDLPLPRPGPYSFELLVDGIHQASLPFIVSE